MAFSEGHTGLILVIQLIGDIMTRCNRRFHKPIQKGYRYIVFDEHTGHTIRVHVRPGLDKRNAEKWADSIAKSLMDGECGYIEPHFK